MAGPRNVALIRFNHSSQRAAVSFSLGLDLKCGLVMIRLRQELQCISVHRCPKEHQLWSSRYHTAVKTAVGTGLSWGRLQGERLLQALRPPDRLSLLSLQGAIQAVLISQASQMLF